MRKTGSAITLAQLISVIILASAFTIHSAKAETITVPDDYPTIQAAIDAASSGDTIFVRAGVYAENLVVNKKISLIGEDAPTTIIDGSRTGSVVNITSSDVQVTGFTIRNSGPQGWVNAAIRLEGASNCSIYGNNITTNTGYGIWLSSSSDNNSIYGNSITANNLDGIYLLFSHQNSIYENVIKNNRQGIAFGSSSDNNHINGNNIANNGRGIFISSSNYNHVNGNSITNSVDGIRLEGSSSNSISGNNITANTQDSIGLYLSSNSNNIYENSISNNSAGIKIGGSSNNVYRNNITANNNFGIGLGGSSNNVYENNITANSGDGIAFQGYSNNVYGNNIIANTGYGISLSFSHENRIYHNNFVNNAHQVYIHISLNNVWDDGYPSGGNYWSDYNGTDANGDGIGDSPYIINSENKDRYPLVNQWIIPEFPSFLILQIFMTITLLAVIAYKRKVSTIPEGSHPVDKALPRE